MPGTGEAMKQPHRIPVWLAPLADERRYRGKDLIPRVRNTVSSKDAAMLSESFMSEGMPSVSEDDGQDGD
jgi:hypothetical protein